jgi:hypothetical protein
MRSMYFPRAFDTRLAIELGDLINQAYAQFDAFEEGREWSPANGYELTGVLSYVWTLTGALEKGTHGFDVAMDKIRSMRAEKTLQVPMGFVARKRGCAYVIFRGTRTVKEWIRNLSIGLSPYIVPGHGEVHDGFLRTYTSIRKVMAEALSEMKGRHRLVVAGHSLGAALATLAVPDMEKNLSLKVTALYTFGSPRVGNDAFVGAFNRETERRSFRITNTSDIVTSVPPPAPIAGRFGAYFSHVGTPVDMTVQQDDLEKNHSMSVYLSELKRGSRGQSVLGRLFSKGT